MTDDFLDAPDGAILVMDGERWERSGDHWRVEAWPEPGETREQAAERLLFAVWEGDGFEVDVEGVKHLNPALWDICMRDANGA